MSAVTLAHHAPGLSSGPAALSGWHLCPSGRACGVVYFRDDEVVLLEDVRAPPFHKGDGPGRRVCFCFDHTEGDVVDEVKRSGHSSIRDSVREACRQGRSDCERLNPLGRCCLGDVGGILAGAGPPGDGSER